LLENGPNLSGLGFLLRAIRRQFFLSDSRNLSPFPLSPRSRLTRAKTSVVSLSVTKMADDGALVKAMLKESRMNRKQM